MEYQEHGASDEELDSERVSVPEGQENGPSEDDGSEEETEVFDGRTLNSGDWSSLELHCPIYKANGEGSGGKFRGPEHFLHAPRPVSPADPMGVRKSNHNGNKSSPSKSIAAAVAQQAAEDQPQSDSQFTSTGQDQLQSESQSTSTGEEQPQTPKTEPLLGLATHWTHGLSMTEAGLVKIDVDVVSGTTILGQPSMAAHQQQMSEKKRKKHEERPDGPPSKKFAKESPSQNIKVSVIEDGDEWLPVLASTPGFNIPSTLSMIPYTKSRLDASRSSLAIPELLLHSSAHLKLDYTAREESSNGSESHLKHYIGVYDPEAGRLQLVQARKLVIRSTLRSSDHDEKGSDSEKDVPNNLSARSNLGLAFGTKKTQKAIRAHTANAIKASPTKVKSQTSGTGRALDPVASAVVSSMAQFTSSMPTREQLQADIDENKPVPKPNLAAETPAEVYPVEQLVGGTNVLRNMNVKELMDKVKAGEDVKTKSLFVSSRLQGVVLSDDVKRVRTLKYLLLLLEWYKGLKVGNKGAKKVPKDEEMESLIEQYGSEVVRGVGRRFAERGELNKWHSDNLITHICALALALDNFTTDTHDIREDLKLDGKDVQKYFQELGCAIALPTEIERGKLKMTKAERVGHRIARLRLPLVFPKMRVPMTGKKKK